MDRGFGKSTGVREIGFSRANKAIALRYVRWSNVLATRNEQARGEAALMNSIGTSGGVRLKRNR